MHRIRNFGRRVCSVSKCHLALSKVVGDVIRRAIAAQSTPSSVSGGNSAFRRFSAVGNGKRRDARKIDRERPSPTCAVAMRQVLSQFRAPVFSPNEYFNGNDAILFTVWRGSQTAKSGKQIVLEELKHGELWPLLNLCNGAAKFRFFGIVVGLEWTCSKKSLVSYVWFQEATC